MRNNLSEATAAADLATQLASNLDDDISINDTSSDSDNSAYDHFRMTRDEHIKDIKHNLQRLADHVGAAAGSVGSAAKSLVLKTKGISTPIATISTLIETHAATHDSCESTSTSTTSVIMDRDTSAQLALHGGHGSLSAQTEACTQPHSFAAACSPQPQTLYDAPTDITEGLTNPQMELGATDLRPDHRVHAMHSLALENGSTLQTDPPADPPIFSLVALSAGERGGGRGGSHGSCIRDEAHNDDALIDTIKGRHGDPCAQVKGVPEEGLSGARGGHREPAARVDLDVPWTSQELDDLFGPLPADFSVDPRADLDSEFEAFFGASTPGDQSQAARVTARHGGQQGPVYACMYGGLCDPLCYVYVLKGPQHALAG